LRETSLNNKSHPWLGGFNPIGIDNILKHFSNFASDYNQTLSVES